MSVRDEPWYDAQLVRERERRVWRECPDCGAEWPAMRVRLCHLWLGAGRSAHWVQRCHACGWERCLVCQYEEALCALCSFTPPRLARYRGQGM